MKQLFSALTVGWAVLASTLCVQAMDARSHGVLTDVFREGDRAVIKVHDPCHNACQPPGDGFLMGHRHPDGPAPAPPEGERSADVLVCDASKTFACQLVVLPAPPPRSGTDTGVPIKKLQLPNLDMMRCVQRPRCLPGQRTFCQSEQSPGCCLSWGACR